MIVELKNERMIVGRCQDGDIKAFELLYNHFEKPMYMFALRMLNSEDAREALQITFIKLHKMIGNYRFQSKLSTYLFKILIHVCYDLQKKKKNSHLQLTEHYAESGYTNDNELKIQLEQAISNLPERMRECFVLFAVEGFKQDEIAEMLAISTGAVKAHIFKAKQKLKTILAESI